MSSESTSFVDNQEKESPAERQSPDPSDFQNQPSRPTAPPALIVPPPPLHSNSNPPEPIELPRRTRTGSALGDTKKLLRRFRRHPVDHALKEVSRDAPEHPKPPRPRPGTAPCDFTVVLGKVLPKVHCQTNYPEFDAAGSYVQDPDILSRLWTAETQRLMQIAESPNDPLEFSSNGFFEGDTEKGYRDISRLCQTILTALTICLLDNECINAKHCGRLSNQQRLSGLVKSVSKGQGAAENVASAEDPGARKRAESSLEATYSLLNYISAVLTRLIVQTSPGPYWQTNVLSVLIRRITKIKVLLIDLPTNSAISLRAADAVLTNVREAGETHWAGDGMDEEEECEEYMRMVEASEREGTASFEDKQVATHCVEQNKFRYGLNSALREVLMSMRFINRSGLPATAFEICAVAYETGFEGFKVSRLSHVLSDTYTSIIGPPLPR